MQPYSPKIKRKPVPSFDLRYPPPDPADPFAPLWVLRSRPSNPVISSLDSTATIRQTRKQPSYDLYPHSTKSFNNHRRRRSQSSPPVSPARRDDDTNSSDLDPDTPQPATLISYKPSQKNFVEHSDPVNKLNDSCVSDSSLSSFVHVSRDDNRNHHSLAQQQQQQQHYTTTPSTDGRKPVAIPSSISAPIPVSNLISFHLRQDKHKRTLSVSAQQLHHHHHHHHQHTARPIPRPTPGPTLTPAQDAEWSLPTPTRLAQAAQLPVIAPSGLRMPFASLFANHRTIVLFIRHFWCPLCQDYLTSVADVLGRGRTILAQSASGEKSVAAAAGEQEAQQVVDLVVISNGSPAYIPKYKQLFNLSCKMYTDPSLAVYEALGMGRDTTTSASISNPVPCAAHSCTNQRHHDGTTKRETMTPKRQNRVSIRDGTYVRHGTVSGIAMVVMRALKTSMPVWERGGDVHQLGGEFVLGPGLKCTYAHRMQSTKGHAPIRDVLAAAGVRVLPARPFLLTPAPPPSPLRRPLVATTVTSPTPPTKKPPILPPTREHLVQSQRRSTNSVYSTNPVNGSALGVRTSTNTITRESGLATPEAPSGGAARRFSVDGTNLWVHYPVQTAMSTTAAPPPGGEKSSSVGITPNRNPRHNRFAPASVSDSETLSPSRDHKKGGGGGGRGVSSSSSSDLEPTAKTTTTATKRESGRDRVVDRLKERNFEQQRLGAPGAGAATKPHVSVSVRSLDGNRFNEKDTATAAAAVVRRAMSDGGHYSSSPTTMTTSGKEGLSVDLSEVMVIGFAKEG